MRVQPIAAAALLVSSMTFTPGAIAQAAPTVSQDQPTDFTRPDVAPLPAEGKFQVVSDTAWSSDKVRVFFLGAQF
jgi:hypothetical protein